jgi:hypothetical protein
MGTRCFGSHLEPSEPATEPEEGIDGGRGRESDERERDGEI